jgi:NADPH:quinone reductase-like Zn-dependent oxidoreductase
MTHTTRPTDTVTETMTAIVQDGYGTAERLRLGTRPTPSIGETEVLVRVHAAGLDRGTEHLMTGTPYAMRPVTGLRRPKQPVPGRDVAGTVVRVGASVTRFSVGDEVYGVAPGSFAEYAVAREDKLAPKPVNLSFAAAAVVPISGGTALQALTDVGRVQPGQSVLVIGASGGVGAYAVQLAKALGAEVTAVARSSKLDFVRGLGADHAIAYDEQDFAAGAARYDLVLDIGGNTALRRLRRVLQPRGTAVFVGGEGAGKLTGMGRQLRGALLSVFVRQRLALLASKERASDLEKLTVLLEDGRVAPPLDRTFPLADAPEAMRLLARGEIRGKVAITV